MNVCTPSLPLIIYDKGRPIVTGCCHIRPLEAGVAERVLLQGSGQSGGFQPALS